MVNIKDMMLSYQGKRYSEINAQARVCQDIVLKAISDSTLNRNVTIKGGIVMRNLSGDIGIKCIMELIQQNQMLSRK